MLRLPKYAVSKKAECHPELLPEHVEGPHLIPLFCFYVSMGLRPFLANAVSRFSPLCHPELVSGSDSAFFVSMFQWAGARFNGFAVSKFLVVSGCLKWFNFVELKVDNSNN